MKKRLYILLTVTAALSLSACEKWLDVKPANEQPFNQFWNNKEEVDAVMMGAYTRLRVSLNKLVWWGELRGDAVELSSTGLNDADLMSVKSLEILSTNKVCAWLDLYSVIGRCNAVIDYADLVRERDNTFTLKACEGYVAEAKWMRALAYFYLVRAFRDVPYVTEPCMTDDIDFRVPKKDGYEILALLIDDLEAEKDRIAIAFKAGSWENKGRATVWALYALLADINLWMGEYDATIEWCDRIENSGLFTLMDAARWYENFHPGNSAESIFELQWSRTYDQSNNLFSWFWGTNNNHLYVSSLSLIEKFGIANEDIRGASGSMLSTSPYKIWKYAGTTFHNTTEPPVRGSENYDNNWIIYRFAEIILMRAEALIMKGPNHYTEAYTQIMRLRERALCSLHIPLPGNESEMIDLLLNEKLREQAFEGKRWFDLVRIATRDDGKHKNKLVEVLLVNVAPKDRPVYQNKLQNTYGYYFPINNNDIISGGGILVQNPYYL